MNVIRLCACDGMLGCTGHHPTDVCDAQVGPRETFCVRCAPDRVVRICPTCGTEWTIPANADVDASPPSVQCQACPPQPCRWCGKPSSFEKECACWISLDGMPLADIKAIFAADGGFNIGGIQ